MVMKKILMRCFACGEIIETDDDGAARIWAGEECQKKMEDILKEHPEFVFSAYFDCATVDECLAKVAREAN